MKLYLALHIIRTRDYRYRVEHHFQQYFSNLLAVSFIGGGSNKLYHRMLNPKHLSDKVPYNVELCIMI